MKNRDRRYKLKLLTNKRAKWGEERDTQVFKGNTLPFPISPAARYRKSLESMIQDMLADYDRQITRLIKTRPELTMDAPAKPIRQTLNELSAKWGAIFAQKAQALADRLIGQVDRVSHTTLNASLREMSGGLTIKTPAMPAALRARLSASVAENIALIRSIPDTYHGKLSGIILRSVQQGGTGTAQLLDEIKSLNVVTENRAELIAVDQTKKINSAMNTERMRSAGVNKFEWIHSGGGKEPRELHVRYDGQIFDINDPPIIDERTGERGMPGVLLNCKCKARPIVDFTQYLNNDEQAA